MAEEWLRQRGLVPPVLTLGSNTAVREAARAGLGLGLVSRTSAALELRMGLLGTIRPRGGLPQRHWFVVRSTVGPPRPAADAFVAFLASPAARQVLNRVLEMR
jgi:DNA-binding transcriptional LysR family regulator